MGQEAEKDPAYRYNHAGRASVPDGHSGKVQGYDKDRPGNFHLWQRFVFS